MPSTENLTTLTNSVLTLGIPRPEPEDVLPESAENNSDDDIDIMGEEEENDDDKVRIIFI